MEKPTRKKIDKSELQMPDSIEQLIQYYDLDNVWIYIEKIIDEINRMEG